MLHFCCGGDDATDAPRRRLSIKLNGAPRRYRSRRSRISPVRLSVGLGRNAIRTHVTRVRMMNLILEPKLKVSPKPVF